MKNNNNYIKKIRARLESSAITYQKEINRIYDARVIEQFITDLSDEDIDKLHENFKSSREYDAENSIHCCIDSDIWCVSQCRNCKIVKSGYLPCGDKNSAYSKYVLNANLDKASREEIKVASLRFRRDIDIYRTNTIIFDMNKKKGWKFISFSPFMKAISIVFGFYIIAVWYIMYAIDNGDN